jgi:hypothetical protein
MPKDTVIVAVESHACPEGCPDYTLTLIATGDKAGIQYEGRDHVLVMGTHHAAMTAAEVKELKRLLRAAQWGPSAGGAAVAAHILMSPVKTERGYSTDKDLVRQLLTLGDAARWTRGDAETVSALDPEGWDFSASDPEHAALLVGAAGDGNVALVQQLLAHGARVNARGPEKQLPLFAAIEGHHTDVVRALLQAHADQSLKSADGESARDLARELGYSDIAALLQ